MMEQLGSEPVTTRDGKETTQESFNAIYMMADSGRAVPRRRSASWPA